MLDHLLVIFWSLAYLLIIAAGWKSRELRLVSIPHGAVLLNFAWEACALQFFGGLWSHCLWFGLDVVIFTIGFLFLKSRKHCIFYAAVHLSVFFLLWYVFTLPQGIPLSAFIIDLLMAMLFLLERRRLSPILQVPIAICKLLGDACAGIFYGKDSGIVAAIAIAVFLCNGWYLWLCCKKHRLFKGKPLQNP